MATLVLRMGIVPTLDGDAFALLALLPGGLINVELGSSWAAAARSIAPKLEGPVTCDELLSPVGRELGWKTVTPTTTERLYAASIALGMSTELVVHDESLTNFCSAWCAFFKLRLWEQLAADLSLRTLRRQRHETIEQAITILGQSGIQFGLAFYEKPSDFDAVMSGEPVSFSGLSVLADDEPGLGPVFAPLGVPPPRLTRIVNRKGKRPGLTDFILATALMELLVGVSSGDLSSRTLSPGVTIELKRDEPKPRPERSRRADQPRRSKKKRPTK